MTSSLCILASLLVLAAPPPPVLMAPAPDAWVGARPLVASGSAAPGTTVEVFVDGLPAGSAEAAANGEFVVPVPPLAEGTHLVFAVARSASGASAPSATVRFAVDLTPPDAPLVLAPATGALVTERAPRASGTAEPGATVVLFVDGAGAAIAAAAADGSWSAQLPPLSDGPHMLVAVARDRAGNESVPGVPSSFSVEATAPPAPEIGSPREGAILARPEVDVEGHAAPGALVRLTVDGIVAAEVTAEPVSGSFAARVGPLPDGAHALAATARDAAGNTSARSTPISFEVDTTPPAAPLLASPAAASAVGPRPVFSGAAEPWALVTVRLDGADLPDVPAGPDGLFAAAAGAPLAEGAHRVSARARDAAGNLGEPSGEISFTVDATAPAPPILTSPPPGAALGVALVPLAGTSVPGAAVAVSIDGLPIGAPVRAGADGAWRLVAAVAEGPHAATAIALDAAGNASTPSLPLRFVVDLTPPSAPAILRPSAGAWLASRRPEIAGTAEAGSAVTVFVDDAAAGSAVADGTGAWSLVLARPLADGAHVVAARARDAAGNDSASGALVPFAIAATPPRAPIVSAPSSGAVLAAPAVAFRGAADPGCEVEIVLDGRTTGVTALTGGDGAFAMLVPVAEGAHLATAIARGPAGVASAPAAPVGFRVLGAPPGRPDIVSPAPGALLSTAAPILSGLASPESDIEVILDGAPAGRARADKAGAFGLALSSIADGMHAVTAIAHDAAGNRSEPSVPISFSIDTTAPGAPRLDAVPRPVRVATPALSGSAEPSARIEVVLAGALAATADCDRTGRFSAQLPRLDDGTHAALVYAVDAAGNRSPPAQVAIPISTRPPPAPVIESPANFTQSVDQPVLRGTAAGAVRVRLRLDGLPLAEADVAADGGWAASFPAGISLSAGYHLLAVTALDAQGGESPPSTAVFYLLAPQEGWGAAPQAPAGRVGGRGCAAGGGAGGPGALLVLAFWIVHFVRRRCS